MRVVRGADSAAAAADGVRPLGQPVGAWRWAWLAWLTAFLLIEIPAWMAERAGGARTLSRHCWYYFHGWRRIPLAVFLCCLSGHLVFGAGWWLTSGAAIAVTGLPVLLIFAAGVMREARRG